MNENINLVEILKDCPKGTKLYSPVYGELEFTAIVNDNNEHFPIRTIDGICFSINGKEANEIHSVECMLFPSKYQRDWSKFKPKFDPKTLHPFDKVLVRDDYKERWLCGFFSHIEDGIRAYKYATIDSAVKYCIPYNEDTKHLVGTTKDAPEYYRYWED